MESNNKSTVMWKKNSHCAFGITWKDFFFIFIFFFFFFFVVVVVYFCLFVVVVFFFFLFFCCCFFKFKPKSKNLFVSRKPFVISVSVII